MLSLISIFYSFYVLKEGLIKSLEFLLFTIPYRDPNSYYGYSVIKGVCTEKFLRCLLLATIIL